MESLAQNLQTTINNLEKVRDSQDNPPDALYDALDQLYEQQIVLIGAAIQNATSEYTMVNKAMHEAAKQTSEAIEDLVKVENAINHVATAMSKVSGLLTKLS